MNCEGENPHNTDIWAILTVKFDTVYKVLNYLPNILISHLLFSAVHEVPFTPVKCIYFPTEPFWVMSPIRSENSEEMQHNLEQEDNKMPELLPLNPACFKINFFFPWWFSACHNHLFTLSLISHDILESKLRALNVNTKLLRFIHEAKSPSCP